MVVYWQLLVLGRLFSSFYACMHGARGSCVVNNILDNSFYMEHGESNVLRYFSIKKKQTKRKEKKNQISFPFQVFFSLSLAGRWFVVCTGLHSMNKLKEQHQQNISNMLENIQYNEKNKDHYISILHNQSHHHHRLLPQSHLRSSFS